MVCKIEEYDVSGPYRLQKLVTSKMRRQSVSTSMVLWLDTTTTTVVSSILHITNTIVMKKLTRMSRKLTRHHLIPKERKKLHTVPYSERHFDDQRVLMLWRYKHDVWHTLFHNMTLHEIIATLQRIEQIKYSLK